MGEKPQPVEYALFSKYGSGWILGADEVGRGALAGPIVAACCAVSEADTFHPEVWDSKRLTPRERRILFRWIRCHHRVTVSALSHHEIDNHGISYCNRTVLERSVLQHAGVGNFQKPILVTLIDGSMKISLPAEYHHRCMIQGDVGSYAIGCASIVAKCLRDYILSRLSRQYPHYGLDHHKGYGTAGHVAALKAYGLSAIHRKGFCHTALFTHAQGRLF